MSILLQVPDDFKIHKLPPYRAKPLTSEKISSPDQIAFMAQFYPPLPFLKLTFKELQTSASSSSTPRKLSKDLRQQNQHIHSSHESEQSLKEEKQYEMSEIKPQNREFATHQRKIRGKNKKQCEGSQLEYRQLLDDLSFQKNIHMSDSVSQNLQNQDFHFQLSQDEHSYISSGKKRMNHQKEKYQMNPQQQNENLHRESLIYLKWDSPQEISFRKQNKLKRIFRIFYKKLLKVYEESIDNIKKIIKNTEKKECERKNNSKLQNEQNNSKKQKSNKLKKPKVSIC